MVRLGTMTRFVNDIARLGSEVEFGGGGPTVT